MNGCVDGWMNGCVDGWMNGLIIIAYVRIITVSSSAVGLRGERWPGLSAPIPTTTYGPNWIKEKELEMRVVKGDEKEWEESRVLNILPGQWITHYTVNLSL